MPYDSNGIATVTRQAAVTGQTILAVQVNTPFEDIESMLSEALLRTGVAPMGANLNMASFKIINVAEGTNPGDAVEFSQLEEKSDELQPYESVTSAATTDLGATTSQNILMSGSATITSFGTAPAGTERHVVFSSVMTIVHNSTSLILPGGVNVTTAARNSLRAVSLGSGNWRVTDFSPSITAGTGLTSTGALVGGMTLTVELTQLGAATTLTSPRVVVTDGVTVGSSARMVPNDFKKTFEVSGFYSGSSANLTNYPIGTTLFVRRDNAAAINRNETGNVFYRGADSQSFSRASVGNTQLSGTWVSRGDDGSATGFLFMQKIAD